MAPSITEITKLLESVTKPKLPQKGKDLEPSAHLSSLDQLFSDNINFQIAGHEFDLACQVQGIQALKEHIASPSVQAAANFINVNELVDGDIIRVIGGGDSPWAAAIIKGTATSRQNKPINHEMVVTMCFNDDGRICEFKAYMDTLHVQNHILENSK